MQWCLLIASGHPLVSDAQVRRTHRARARGSCRWQRLMNLPRTGAAGRRLASRVTPSRTGSGRHRPGLDGHCAACQSAGCAHITVGYQADRLTRTTNGPAVDPPRTISTSIEAHVSPDAGGNHPHYTLEKRYLHRGEIIWTTLTVALVRDAERTVPTYFISIIEDSPAEQGGPRPLRLARPYCASPGVSPR